MITFLFSFIKNKIYIIWLLTYCKARCSEIILVTKYDLVWIHLSAGENLVLSERCKKGRIHNAFVSSKQAVFKQTETDFEKNTFYTK